VKRRPIKFRFFCVPAKGFIEAYRYNGHVDDLFNEEDPLLLPSQYTGMLDDYGNEIWEGDIVQFKRKDRDRIFNAEIDFVEGGFMAKIIKHEGTLSFFWLAHINDYKDIKVIGNKFENPELLS
jgi:uncharacterized phage protein (TIGR01671 family)